MRARFSVVAAVLASCLPAAAQPDQRCPEGWFCEPDLPDPRPRPAPPAPAESPVHAAPASPRSAPSPQPVVDRHVGALVRARCTIPEVYDGARPLMGGAGLGFRAAPLAHLAVDVAVDAIGGSDALNARRRELAASAALVLFFNNRQPVQVFLSSGLFHSWAHVAPTNQADRNFRYLGAFMGLGAQYALSRAYALSIDITFFVRGRVDAASPPEFINQTTGETSNASGGSLAGFAMIRSF